MLPLATALAKVDSDTGFYVGWGTLSLINAGLAQSKHRSGLNWFVVSLLLGPIATFLLVAVFEPLDDESE